MDRVLPSGGSSCRARLHAHFAAIAGEETAALLAATLLGSVSASLAALRAARARDDLPGVRATLHKLRGALLNGGLDAEASTAHALEIGEPGERWSRDVEAFEAAIDALIRDG